VAFAVFVAALLPSIGIVPFNFQRYSTVADRYLYIAMLGPALAAAFFLARFGSRLVIVSTVGVLVVLACLSINQLSHWQDDWTLMNYTYEVNPRSLSASSGLMYLLTPWQHDKPPDGPFPAARLCTLDQPTLIGLADRLREHGAWILAEPAYQKVIARGTKNAAIYIHLGDCLANEDNTSAAIQAYQEATRLDPTNIDARTHLDALRDRVTPQ
jgi:tetratricopeptide (TPR) repeat protein